MPTYTIITPDFKISKKMISEHNLERKKNCYKLKGKKIPSPLPPISNKTLQIMYNIINDLKEERVFEVGYQRPRKYATIEEQEALDTLVSILKRQKRIIVLPYVPADTEGETIINIFTPEIQEIFRQFI